MGKLLAFRHIQIFTIKLFLERLIFQKKEHSLLKYSFLQMLSAWERVMNQVLNTAAFYCNKPFWEDKESCILER